MSATQTGKCTNLKTNEVLPFMSNPHSVTISSQNDYEFNSVIGDETWVTSYIKTMPKTLGLTLEFNDQVADEEITKKAYDFFKTCDQLDSESKRKPEVKIEMGFINFTGVLNNITYSFGNFDTAVNPNSVVISLALTGICEGL